jgi:hypothetical protein
MFYRKSQRREFRDIGTVKATIRAFKTNINRKERRLLCASMWSDYPIKSNDDINLYFKQILGKIL